MSVDLSDGFDALICEHVLSQDGNGLLDIPAVMAKAVRLTRQEFCEVIQYHQSLSWRTGNPVRLEQYLQHDGTDEGSSGWLVDLVYAEMCLEEECHETVDLQAYLDRFPKIADELNRQWFIHDQFCCLESHEAPTTDGEVIATDPLAGSATDKTPEIPQLRNLRHVGAGGMGVVYKGYHEGLERDVAVKMIRSGTEATAHQLARHDTEAKAIAQCRHPNIVAVYESGDVDGNPYFVMEYVDGQNLADAIKHKPYTAAESVAVVHDLAAAIDYAHGKGILHRDLKPQNIMIDSDGDLRIMDFGLSRIGFDSQQTQTGEIFGTLDYMAPEQASGDTKDHGPWTDVYALGVILFQLLAQRVPHQAQNQLQLYRKIISETPQSPRTYSPGISVDLDRVVMKAIAKEPQDRYQTAKAFAHELTCIQQGTPVSARPVTLMSRCFRWAKRNPVPLAVSLLLLAGLIGTSFFGIRSSQNAKLADDNAIEARDNERTANRYANEVRSANDRLSRNLYASEMRIAWELAQQGELATATDVLNRLVPEPGQIDHRGSEWYFVWNLCHDEFLFSTLETVPWGVIASPQDSTVVIREGAGGRMNVWDVDQGEKLYQLNENSLAKPIFVADGSVFVGRTDGAICVWETKTGHRIHRIPIRHRGMTLGTLPDSKHVAISVPDDESKPQADRISSIEIYELASGKRTRSFKEFRGRIRNISVSPNGKWIACSGHSNKIHVWNFKTGELIQKLESPSVSIAMEFSPDSSKLVAGGWARRVHAWSTKDWKQIAKENCGSTIFDLCHSVDGQYLFTVGNEGKLIVWNAKTFELLPTDELRVGNLRFLDLLTKSGDLLIAGAHLRDLVDRREGVGGFAVRLDSATGQQKTIASKLRETYCDHLRIGRALLSVAVGNMGELVFLDTNNQLHRIDVANEKNVWSAKLPEYARHRTPVGRLEGNVQYWLPRVSTGIGLRKSPEEQLVACWTKSSDIAILSCGDGSTQYHVATKKAIVDAEFLDENALLVVEKSGEVSQWNLKGKQPTRASKWSVKLSPQVASISPKCNMVAIANENMLQLWDLKTSSLSTQIELHGKPLQTLKLSKDSSKCWYSTKDGGLYVADARSKQIETLRERGTPIVKLSPQNDGRRLWTSEMGKLRVWETSVHREILSMTEDRLYEHAFSDDESALIISYPRDLFAANIREQTNSKFRKKPSSGQLVSDAFKDFEADRESKSRMLNLAKHCWFALKDNDLPHESKTYVRDLFTRLQSNGSFSSIHETIQSWPSPVSSSQSSGE